MVRPKWSKKIKKQDNLEGAQVGSHRNRSPGPTSMRRHGSCVPGTHFFLVAFCLGIIATLFCSSGSKCTEWEGTGRLSILLPSCVSPFFVFAESHDEPARTVRDRSTGHLSAEGLPETPCGGPFEHYIQSKCHLQPRCKTLMIWP